VSSKIQKGCDGRPENHPSASILCPPSWSTFLRQISATKATLTGVRLSRTSGEGKSLPTRTNLFFLKSRHCSMSEPPAAHRPATPTGPPVGADGTAEPQWCPVQSSQRDGVQCPLASTDVVHSGFVATTPRLHTQRLFVAVSIQFWEEAPWTPS